MPALSGTSGPDVAERPAPPPPRAGCGLTGGHFPFTAWAGLTGSNTILNPSAFATLEIVAKLGLPPADNALFSPTRERPVSRASWHIFLPRVSHGGRSVIVTIDDRGPACWTDRAFDLSRGVAAHLAMLGAGVARVHVQILE